MEYLEGETLEQRLIRGPLPPEQTLRYAAQIAGALAKAHKLGITHRDLKPANVMLTKSGAKLMDFGLAKQSGAASLANALTEMTADQAKLTSDGMIVGTFQYMAPEPHMTRLRRFQRFRDDLLQAVELPRDQPHALSVTGMLAGLVRLANPQKSPDQIRIVRDEATGKPAFTGKSRASLIAAILTTEPPPISQLQPMTPVALEHVVKKCLAKDPDERWQSASDLASELHWISQSPAQAVEPAHRQAWRNRSFGAAAGLAVLLAALAGAEYWRLRTSAPANLEFYVPAPGKGALNTMGAAGAPAGQLRGVDLDPVVALPVRDVRRLQLVPVEVEHHAADRVALHVGTEAAGHAAGRNPRCGLDRLRRLRGQAGPDHEVE